MLLSSLALDASSSPTIFEISMANGLSQSSFRAAFDYALHVFANRGNSFALAALPRRLELFALVMFGVDRYYLDEYESSLAENFYGLKRTLADGKPLTPQKKLTSLLETVLLPYIRAKSEEQIKARPIKYIWAFFDLVNLVFQIAYLFGKTKYYSLMLRLQGVVLARITGDDAKQFQERAAATSVAWSTNKTRYLTQKLTTALRYSITFGMVFYTLFAHFQSSESRAMREAQQRRLGAFTAPPPPLPLPPLPEARALLQDPKLCPLCGMPRQNPALSSSGYCFCYDCIHRYVEQFQKCPVTGTPCHPLEIRRIYIA